MTKNTNGDDEPILPPHSLVDCAACEGGMRLVQSVLRDNFVQVVTENFFGDLCWLLVMAIDHNSCSLFVD
jgi:hypothetical protein